MKKYNIKNVRIKLNSLRKILKEKLKNKNFMLTNLKKPIAGIFSSIFKFFLYLILAIIVIILLVLVFSYKKLKDFFE